VARSDKATAVAEISEAFTNSSAAVLTEYRGLTVAQITRLRRALGTTTRYAVVKNTLTKIAARDAGVEGLDDLLQGPTAVAFVEGDPVEAAKGLRDFARTHPALVVKGGVLDGKAISPDEIRRLADLESREVLLSKLAGAFNGSLSQAASLFQAPLSQAARVAEALRQKAEEDPSVLAGGAGTALTGSEAAPAGEAPAEGSGDGAESPGEGTGGEQPLPGSDPTSTGDVPSTPDTEDPGQEVPADPGV
jgi:large subunit ribosomal protein L10